MNTSQVVEAVEQCFARYYSPALKQQIADEAVQRAHDTILADFQAIVATEVARQLQMRSLDEMRRMLRPVLVPCEIRPPKRWWQR